MTIGADTVDDATIVVGDGLLVVSRDQLLRRLEGVGREGGAIEGGGQTGGDVAHLVSGGAGEVGEGAGGAGEDVLGGGFGEGADVGEGQGTVGDGAVYDAPFVLGVDGQGVFGVLRPDGVDIGLVVAVEERVVHDDAGVGAEGAEVGARGGLDDEFGPACSVFGVLRGQGGTDGIQTVGRDARDGLGRSRGVGETHRDGHADEVDIGDVGEELGGIVGELGKGPEEVVVGVGLVGYRGLDNGRTGVQLEGKLCVLRQPHPTTCNLRDGDNFR